jgi:hypothetical protein
MSRVILPPKTNHTIAVGIDPAFQMWFIQVFDLPENQNDDESEKLLVDMDTSNRWKVIEVIDEYADSNSQFVAEVKEFIFLDLDPGLILEQKRIERTTKENQDD